MQINTGKSLKKLSLIFLLVQSFAVAQTTAVNPDSALQIVLKKLEGDNLSLAQAREYAIKNATSLRSAEAEYLAASGSLRKERGYFDPELFFNLNYQDSKTPTASFFAGADVLATKQTTSQTGLRLKLPVGTEFELSVNTTSLKTNSQFAFLNPEYDAFGSLSFRQPLLKGFLTSGRKDLTQAELQYDAAKARYDQATLAVEADVEQNYWSLYAAERNYAVQVVTCDRGKAFLREAELKQKAGLVGPSDVANAKTFLAQQELLLIDKKELLDEQSDQLAALIGTRPGNGNIRFKAIDNPPYDFPVEPIGQVVNKVLGNNLDLKAAQKDVDASNSLVKAANWAALPSIDLVGSLSSSGIGGDSQNVIFGGDTLRSTSSGSFGDVLNQVFKRQFPGWSIGVEISVPIGFRPGLGEKDRLEAQELSAREKYIELSRNLEQQVRSAHRQLSDGTERLKVAADGVAAAQEQVRIGMIEFNNGRITAFELVRLSEDFANAQQRYSDALVKTVKAEAELKKLTSGFYSSTEN
jgi:outer membrane protein TolC